MFSALCVPCGGEGGRESERGLKSREEKRREGKSREEKRREEG
jgi:hypothetical protein